MWALGQPSSRILLELRALNSLYFRMAPFLLLAYSTKGIKLLSSHYRTIHVLFLYYYTCSEMIDRMKTREKELLLNTGLRWLEDKSNSMIRIGGFIGMTSQ